ncbi:MAG TPA: LuxR C-terminal-related transcriptional regulator [Candidatus Binatia bacterium]|jgi:DNA-binding CsgD family transcriptional regulator|nr:LuxR C-terminal-related transcriptional regulator [Candidatus Binatia bacterium]
MPAARGSVRPHSSRETARLLAAVEILAPLVMLDEFPAVALRAVGALMSWSALSYNEVDPVGQRLVFFMEPSDLATVPGLSERWARHVGDHPLIQHYERTGDRSAHAISDYLSAAAFHRTGLYRDVYASLGVEDQLSVQLDTRPPHIVAVVVSRGRRGFSPADRRLLNALLPHLDAAYANAHRHTHLYVALERLGIALEDEHRGVGIVGDDGRWQRLTPPARRMVREYLDGTADGAEEGGDAPAALVSWVRRQRGSSASGVGAPLVVERPPLRLAVHCMPAPGAPDVLLLEEQQLDGPGDPLMALGLSQREAELLRLLSAGHPNADIAHQLGLRVGTVKKHVEHILQKLHVRNRTEASKVALHAMRD